MSVSLPRRLFRHTLGKWLPRGMVFRVLRGPMRGTRFVLGSAAGEGGGVSVYFNLVEPEKTRAFVNMISEGQVLFDIGANIGYYSLLGSRLVGSKGKVFAFEPVVRNLAYLYRHVVLNRVENVMIIPAACSNQLAIAGFSLGENCAVGHLALNQVDHHQPGADNSRNTVVVTTVTVDELVRYTNVFPNVLKIDVEGAEFQVLQGAYNTLTKASPSILLAVHSSDLRSACTDYLKGMDYVLETVCGDDHGDAELLAIRA